MYFIRAEINWPRGHSSNKIRSLSWMSRSTSPLLPTLSSSLIIVAILLNFSVFRSEAVVPYQPSPFHNFSCQASEDCIDPNKECINGRCFCKPYFDEIPFHTEDGSNPHYHCRKTFGAACVSTSDEELICNPHKLLKCSDKRDGVCVCVDEESPLIYDYYLETCAAFPGNKCDLMKLSDHEIRCIRNAECVTADWSGEHGLFYGVCRCSRGYVEYGEPVRCVPKLGSKCMFASDCNYDESLGMECIRGKCSCSKNTTYNLKEHRCQVKVGLRCELDWENCAEGSSCVVSNEKANHEWRCMCNEGYHDTGNGTCIEDKFDISGCGNSSEDFEVFDHFRGKCSVKVGRPCRTWGKNPCVSHAFCGTGSKCQCYNGFAETKERTCEKEIEDKREELWEMQSDAGPSSHPHQSPVNNIGSSLFSGVGTIFRIIVFFHTLFILTFSRF